MSIHDPEVLKVYSLLLNPTKFLKSFFYVSTGEKATKWETQDPRESCVDGLTTNGVLVMSPNGVFCPGDSQLFTSDSQNQDDNAKKTVSPAKPGLWREISVIHIFLSKTYLTH